MISRGVVESNHAGFTGSGFVNYDNVAGSYVEFSVTSDGGPLTLRYANGTSADRPLAISVDGGAAVPVSFPGTGAWTNWQARQVPVTLPAGTAKVRAAATTSSGGPNLDSLTVGSGGFDWSVAVVESTMAAKTPAQLGSWGYQTGLYLYGQYLVYQRTRDPRYLAYIRAWVDRFVDSSGNISHSFNNLDSMLSGRLLVILHRETGSARYEKAARKIRTRLNTYPRTSDGGFWHATSRPDQLWADGVFMVNPFLVEFGSQFADSSYANDEAARQLAIYAAHLQQPNGILRHAWDEARTQTWANRSTGLAPENWCRAMGWWGMASIDVLEKLPLNHPRRAQVLTDLREYAAGVRSFQDPASGRWFQVVDKGSRSDNWTETSCSMMFTFVFSRGVERGYLDQSYQDAAARGYAGVLAKASVNSQGRTEIRDISIGTNVGDYAYYIARTKATNDFHGLGAFLIMNEQLQRAG